MEVTPAKRRANGRNALKCTGPRTKEGKAAASRNALRHGILSREAVIAAGEAREDGEAYDALLADLRRHFRPEGVMEEMLVEKIAVCHWRLARVLRCENGTIRDGVKRRRRDGHPPKDYHVTPGLARSIIFLRRLHGTPEGLRYLIRLLERGVAELKEEGSLSKEAETQMTEFFIILPLVCGEKHDYWDDWTQSMSLVQNASKDGPTLEVGVRFLEMERERLRNLLEAFSEGETGGPDAEAASLALPGEEAGRNLVRYERMLDNQLYRAMRQLERLQRMRRGEAVPPPISIGI